MKQANKYIVGIYNYCDYWCERCAFTKRCRNFMTDRELELEMAAADATKPEPDDATNADFWKHIARKVHETAAFGKAEDWHDSIPDEDDFEIDPVWQARDEAISEAVRSHPLIRLAYDYRARTAEWLKAADTDLKEVARSLLAAAGSQFDSNDYETQAREIGEMLKVASWYHTLIASKTARAVRGLLEHATPDPDLSPLIAGFRLEDANGSAKLVLMSIERSIGAWLRPARDPAGAGGFHSRAAGAAGPHAAGRPRRPARRKSLLSPRLRWRTARGGANGLIICRRTHFPTRISIKGG